MPIADYHFDADAEIDASYVVAYDHQNSVRLSFQSSE